MSERTKKNDWNRRRKDLKKVIFFVAWCKFDAHHKQNNQLLVMFASYKRACASIVCVCVCVHSFEWNKDQGTKTHLKRVLTKTKEKREKKKWYLASEKIIININRYILDSIHTAPTIDTISTVQHITQSPIHSIHYTDTRTTTNTTMINTRKRVRESRQMKCKESEIESEQASVTYGCECR